MLRTPESKKTRVRQGHSAGFRTTILRIPKGKKARGLEGQRPSATPEPCQTPIHTHLQKCLVKDGPGRLHKRLPSCHQFQLAIHVTAGASGASELSTNHQLLRSGFNGLLHLKCVASYARFKVDSISRSAAGIMHLTTHMPSQIRCRQIANHQNHDRHRCQASMSAL